MTKPKKARGGRVLLVDDFSDNREMYAVFLKASGFQVAEAANGHEAIEQALKVLPDIIVMDLSLPGMDGWEATRRLKADVRTKHIPILALTGHALGGHSKSAAEAGCDGFVTKPCLPDELLRHIRILLDNPPPDATAKPAPETKPKRGR